MIIKFWISTLTLLFIFGSSFACDNSENFKFECFVNADPNNIRVVIKLPSELTVKSGGLYINAFNKNRDTRMKKFFDLDVKDTFPSRNSKFPIAEGFHYFELAIKKTSRLSFSKFMEEYKKKSHIQKKGSFSIFHYFDKRSNPILKTHEKLHPMEYFLKFTKEFNSVASFDYNFFFIRGEELYYQNKYEQAEPLFLKSLKIEPNHVRSLELLGEVLKKAGKQERGNLFLYRSYILNDKLKKGISRLILYYDTKKDFKKVIELANKILEKDPNDLFAQKFLANSYYRLGNLQNAEKGFIRAHENSPDDEFVSLQLGKVYIGLKKFEKAKLTLSKAADAGSKNPRIFFNLGMALLSNDELTESLVPFNRAASLDHNYKFIEPKLGSMFLDLGRKEHEKGNLTKGCKYISISCNFEQKEACEIEQKKCDSAVNEPNN